MGVTRLSSHLPVERAGVGVTRLDRDETTVAAGDKRIRTVGEIPIDVVGQAGDRHWIGDDTVVSDLHRPAPHRHR